jgi:predicted nucleic acid-binding protein
MSVSLVLDAGALIALERRSPEVVAALSAAHRRGVMVLCPAGVLAQAWRGDGRQARISLLLKHDLTVVLPLDELTSKRVGRLAARTGSSDVVDLSVALAAKDHNAVVLTSDPGDIAAIDPGLVLIAV